MSVSNQAITSPEVLEAAFCQYLGGQIFPKRSIWATVNERTFLKFKTFRQVNEKLTMFLCQLFSGPFSGDPRSLAEILQVNFPNRCPVMVTRDNGISAFT